MANRIFYFTGSGNSLAIAKTLAARLGDTELLPIAKHMRGYDASGAERVGIVTPVLGWGPPRMVKEFAEELKTSTDQYAFGVANCGGTPCNTLKILDRRLRKKGHGLDAGFAVKADFGAPLPGMEIGIIKFVAWLGRNSFPKSFRTRAEEIAATVSSKGAHRLEASNPSANVVGSMMHGAAAGSFKTSDKHFAVGDSCVSCGTCARVCPRENVTLADERPTWHGDCELCYACYLWCPQKAISYQGNRPTDPTHHSEVQVAEMSLR